MFFFISCKRRSSSQYVHHSCGATAILPLFFCCLTHQGEVAQYILCFYVALTTIFVSHWWWVNPQEMRVISKSSCIDFVGTCFSICQRLIFWIEMSLKNSSPPHVQPTIVESLHTNTCPNMFLSPWLKTLPYKRPYLSINSSLTQCTFEQDLIYYQIHIQTFFYLHY